MSREEILTGGFVNQVSLDLDSGNVRKQYQTGNGIGTLAEQRLAAEKKALELVPLAPALIAHTDAVLEMTFISGENQLHTLFPDLSLLMQYKIAHEAGLALATIHRLESYPLTNQFIQIHQTYISSCLESTTNDLEAAGVDSDHIFRYLQETFDKKELSRRGLVLTHGDFWLNNIIGELEKHDFQINGVIDWELSEYHSPYRDFAGVLLSIDQPYPWVSQSFWKGYGYTPDSGLINHFAIIKILEWIKGEDSSFDISSDFYAPKIEWLKQNIQDSYV